MDGQANVFHVTINDTNPIVFYCAQNTGSHCKNGMVGVVNPTGSNTLDSYLTAAKSASTAVSPKSVFGGVVAQLSTSTCTAASTSTSSPPTSSTPNAAGLVGAPLAGLAAAGAVAILLA